MSSILGHDDYACRPLQIKVGAKVARLLAPILERTLKAK